MDTQTRELVVAITQGLDHELSSAGLIIDQGAMTAGLKVSIFLVSSGLDIVRRGAVGLIHVKPLEPLADMLRDFMARGGNLWVCTVCAKNRSYTQEHPLDGVVITGASAIHEMIKRGAATLSF